MMLYNLHIFFRNIASQKLSGRKVEEFLENVFYSIFGFLMFAFGIGTQLINATDLSKISKTFCEIIS